MGYSPGGGGGGGGSGPSPATTVTGPDAYGASAVVGTGTTYARNDHDHGLPANPVTSAASLAAIKASFTAANQIIKGTGNGTGELIDFDTTLNFQFGAKGDLFAGTGSGTGEKLGIGSAGTVLTVGGADASGLEWSAPATVPTASSTVTGPDSYGDAAAVGSATTFSKGDHNHGLPAAPADLPLAGGTMSGAIAMGTNKITGLGNGSAAQDGAAFGQIPTASSTVTGPDAYGASAVVGTGTTYARSDHDHGLPAAPAAAALATAKEIAVGTGSTTIVTLAPATAGNYHIGIYFRVITATTNVTITVTWTDVTGAQTLTLLSVVAETVGSYTLTDFMIDSVITSAITVSMTAGTVSRVLASASILQG